MPSASPERVRISPGALVEVAPMDPDSGTPLLLGRPTTPGVDLTEWIAESTDLVQEWADVHGGVLFRGFGIDSPELFESAARAFGHELLPYSERTSPRVELRPNVYTSTVHPDSEAIHFHNANSYAIRWPSSIWFGCVRPAEAGGETPLVDCRRVLDRLDPEVVEEFDRRGVTYLRNFRDGVGLSWQETFQTDDPSAVRAYCAKSDIEIELFEGDRLRTRQTRPAIRAHHRTGERLWFNQAHLFHISSLPAATRSVFERTYAPDDVPRNAFYGDGLVISDDVVRHVVDTMEEGQIRFPWQKGDFLYLDNMLVAHGRAPYSGDRLTVVSFADLIGADTEVGE